MSNITHRQVGSDIYSDPQTPFIEARRFPFALVQIYFRPFEFQVNLGSCRSISTCLWCERGEIYANGLYGCCISCGWAGDGVRYLSSITGLSPTEAAWLIVKELPPKPGQFSSRFPKLPLTEWVRVSLKELRALIWLIESCREQAGKLVEELPAMRVAIDYLEQADEDRLIRLRKAKRLWHRWGVGSR